MKEWLTSIQDGRNILAHLAKAVKNDDAAKVLSLGTKATISTAPSHSIAGSLGMTGCAS